VPIPSGIECQCCRLEMDGLEERLTEGDGDSPECITDHEQSEQRCPVHSIGHNENGTRRYFVSSIVSHSIKCVFTGHTDL